MEDGKGEPEGVGERGGGWDGGRAAQRRRRGISHCAAPGAAHLSAATTHAAVHAAVHDSLLAAGWEVLRDDPVVPDEGSGGRETGEIGAAGAAEAVDCGMPSGWLRARGGAFPEVRYRGVRQPRLDPEVGDAGVGETVVAVADGAGESASHGHGGGGGGGGGDSASEDCVGPGGDGGDGEEIRLSLRSLSIGGKLIAHLSVLEGRGSAAALHHVDFALRNVPFGADAKRRLAECGTIDDRFDIAAVRKRCLLHLVSRLPRACVTDRQLPVAHRGSELATLDGFGDDVSAQMMQFLGVTEVVQLSMTCTKLRLACELPEVWTSLYVAIFGDGSGGAIRGVPKSVFVAEWTRKVSMERQRREALATQRSTPAPRWDYPDRPGPVSWPQPALPTLPGARWLEDTYF